MIQEAKLLGCSAQFALQGIVDVTTTGTVSKTFIPGNSDVDANSVQLWVPLGVISAAKDQTKPGASIIIYRPTPGTLQADDLKESKYVRTLDLTIEECSPIMWLAMRRAFVPASVRQAGTTVGQFTPISSGTIKGWLKLQSYNQDNQTLEVSDQIWCALQIDGTAYGDDKNAKFDCKITQLFSTLNTAVLS